MSWFNRKRAGLWLAMVALLLVPALLAAGERSPRRKLGQYNPEHESVELFAAMEAGELDVKIIPKDSRQARVFIKNKAGKPLNVKLPEAFVAVPVLAQFGGGGGQQGGFGGGGGGGQQQGGGGMGGGQGGGGQQGGGGFFNVAAEKEGQIKVPMVCLEHGKAEPRPAVPYTIKPITAFSSDPNVAELLKLFAEGRYSQRAAQAAAWHIASNMSWEELAAKQIRRLGGASYPYFSQDELLAAQQMTSVAAQRAKDRPPETTTSPGLDVTAAE